MTPHPAAHFVGVFGCKGFRDIFVSRVGGMKGCRPGLLWVRCEKKHLLPVSLFDRLLRRGCCTSASGYPCYADYLEWVTVHLCGKCMGLLKGWGGSRVWKAEGWMGSLCTGMNRPPEERDTHLLAGMIHHFLCNKSAHTHFYMHVFMLSNLAKYLKKVQNRVSLSVCVHLEVRVK